MIKINRHIIIPDEELKEEFFLSSGAGGQHVNKVATAVRLRFNVLETQALPPQLQTRIIEKYKHRLTNQGEILVEARRSRNREKNRLDASERLRQMIISILHPPRKRRPTKPTRSSVERRLQTKKKHGFAKKQRSQRNFPE
jgi:ribosome-associated protein